MIWYNENIMAGGVEITISGDDVNAAIAGVGILDFTNSGPLRVALANASKSAQTVEVDLRLAEFIDTAILEYLARAGKDMIRREKRLKVVCAPNSHPLRVLTIAGFGGLMDIVVR